MMFGLTVIFTIYALSQLLQQAQPEHARGYAKLGLLLLFLIFVIGIVGGVGR